MSNDAFNVIRVFLFRIDDGDRRKFIAKANDTQSGGGPRDLRVRPEDKFWPFFERLLSERKTVKRPRQGGTTQILVGQIVWTDGSTENSGSLEIWPHQKKRPNECRIAKIYKWQTDHLIKDDPKGGISVLMLFQQQDGVIRLFFTTESVLKAGNWDPAVKSFAKAWIVEASKHNGQKSAFLDLKKKESYFGV